MTENLILDFPILKEDGIDFCDGVTYEVTANREGKTISITHTLKGPSFIRDLVKEKHAVFSVLLVYRDSSERQSCRCDDFTVNKNCITANQKILMEFSYAPEIKPSIVLMKAQKITVNNETGLSDFWDGKQFHLPEFARIAVGLTLQFTGGDLSQLMRIEFKESLEDGEMEVTIYDDAGEGKIPVVLLCGQGVFDELKKIRKDNPAPTNAKEAARSAIITQALCATYAYMNKSSEERELSGVLEAHLAKMEEKNQNWNDENFNPSLAATKMNPYAVDALKGNGDDD